MLGVSIKPFMLNVVMLSVIMFRVVMTPNGPEYLGQFLRELIEGTSEKVNRINVCNKIG
jgi:hypothetical protein